MLEPATRATRGHAQRSVRSYQRRRLFGGCWSRRFERRFRNRRKRRLWRLRWCSGQHAWRRGHERCRRGGPRRRGRCDGRWKPDQRCRPPRRFRAARRCRRRRGRWRHRRHRWHSWNSGGGRCWHGRRRVRRVERQPSGRRFRASVARFRGSAIRWLTRRFGRRCADRCRRRLICHASADHRSWTRQQPVAATCRNPCGARERPARRSGPRP
jgi:hypothetical protein